jgi:hypothetical protein
MKKFIFLGLFLITSSYQAQALEWIYGSNKSCLKVCVDNNMRPVISGIYKNGNPFYVCAANPHGHGFRPGTNLAPMWVDRCNVGWGRQGRFLYTYKCLCR